MPEICINGDSNNADALEQIRRINPEIEDIELHIHGNHADVKDFGLLGHCIGQNKSIREVIIYDYPLFDSQNGVVQDYPISGVPAREWEDFFNGISRSQSIKSIQFYDCHLGGHILKLFDIQNLTFLFFQHCEITNHTVSAIKRVPCLQEVTLSSPHYLNVINAADFIASLNYNRNLECLVLYLNIFQEGEGRGLKDILSDPKSIIKRLVIYARHLSLLQLRNGLVNSSSLCDLAVSSDYMREEHWQVVSDVLSSPVTSLKVLAIRSCSIDDASAVALASGLVRSHTLEELNLFALTVITGYGWLSIFSSLQYSNSPLKQILVRNANTINDEVVSLFGEVLSAKRHTIEEFTLSCCPGITAAGWAILSAAFCTPMLNLRKLEIGGRSFDDDALVAFANGLSNKPSLRILGLHTAYNIERGWEAISKVLCDASSLEAIRESNHTLCEIYGHPGPSKNIMKLLEINRSRSPSEVIILKMINYSDEITMESLVNDESKKQVKLVPSVISLLGRDVDKHTALYNFVRNQSYLLEGACKNASVFI